MVKLVRLDARFDPASGREAAMTLMNQDADVLAFHTGSNAVVVAAEERGKMAVACHSNMRKVAPTAQIAAVTHRWGDYYTARQGRARRQLEKRRSVGRHQGRYDFRQRLWPQGAANRAKRSAVRAKRHSSKRLAPI